MFFVYFLLVVIFVLASFYARGKYNKYYWKKRGVVFYDKFVSWRFLTEDLSFFEIFLDIYKKYPNEPAVGLRSITAPAIYIKDPQNCQFILQTDFPNFNHRGFEVSEHDILANNILFLHGDRWRLLRQSMTPLFTTAKLKNMYYILDKSARDFTQSLKQDPHQLTKGNLFQVCSSFCAAAIGAAVFGITPQGSIYDSPFLKMATKASTPTLKTNIRFAFSGVFTSGLKNLGIKLFGDHEKFFIGAIKRVIRQRQAENDGIQRHDFADMCVSLQKNGKLKHSESGLELEPTDEVLAAQAFFFFIAGVEPTAMSLYGTLLELGRNPDVLAKVHTEIDAIWEKYDGKLSYEAMVEAEYLDKVMSEALRMYPPIGFQTRACVKDTVLPVGNIKIDKGTVIFAPIYEYHHDPQIYKDPEVFDPERFDQDAKGGEITYQPFGKGGRICIGMRYARMQSKAGLVYLLREFTVHTNVLKGGLKFDKQTVQVRPINVEVQLLPRKKKC